jgi:hypothetical protein
MLKQLAVLGVVASLPAALQADFSYQQTTKMTGGAMMGAMRVAGVFSRQAREPMTATVSVKGNRLVHGYKDNSQIIDLDGETITDINFSNKTYSVVTFAEMKEQIEKAMQRISDDKSAQAEFQVSVKATGATRQIAGHDAKEMLLTMTMEGTDQKSGQKGGMAVTTSVWLIPKVSGYDEMTAFYMKMAEKLNWTPGGGGMAAARPDLAKAMAAAAKEMAKLDGMQVLQVMRMMPAMEGQPVSGSGGPAPQQQSQPQAEAPSIGGAIRGIGGFGGFGRKKKQEEPKKEAAAEPAAAPAGDSSGVLMEMTTEMSEFSSASVDASKFAVPAGFKKVDPKR